MGKMIVFCMLILAALLLCGCTDQNHPQKTDTTGSARVHDVAVKTGMNKTEEDRGEKTVNGGEITGMKTGKHETMRLNDTRTISLKENPTTGYMWNATVTTGLAIENDTYLADRVEPGIVGSGGMHYWLIRAVEPGDQTFHAVYKRSWEPDTENDLRFFMNITVV